VATEVVVVDRVVVVDAVVVVVLKVVTVLASVTPRKLDAKSPPVALFLAAVGQAVTVTK
jgi:hypothetical protein